MNMVLQEINLLLISWKRLSWSRYNILLKIIDGNRQALQFSNNPLSAQPETLLFGLSGLWAGRASKRWNKCSASRSSFFYGGGGSLSRVHLEGFDEGRLRFNGVSEVGSMNSSNMDEFDDLVLIAEIYGDFFEGFDSFDRAIEAVEGFIRFVGGS